MSSRDQDKASVKGFTRCSGDFANSAAEDLPKLRSVPLQSKRGPSVMSGPPLGITKPVPGIVSTTMSYFGSSNGGGVRSGGPFLGVQKEWDGSVHSPPATWDVQLEDLEQIPAYFPLEKTHREITEEPSVIASRISAALQALSIQTEFCKRSVKATCQTNDCVSFRIRMYAGSDIGVPVVVEIQRRSGAPSSFVRTCRVLLDAATHGKIPTQLPQAIARDPFTAPKRMMPTSATVAEMKCLQNVTDRVSSTNVSESLGQVLRLLSGDSVKMEHELLALENLFCLTDPRKSAPKTVLEASEAILFQPEVRDLVFQQAVQLPSTSSSHDHHEVGTVLASTVDAADEGIAAFIGRKRQLAYAVFAHSIESVSGCGRSSMKMDDVEHSGWLSTRLIPAIAAALCEASTAACLAYQASRCATLLASHSDQLRSALLVHRTILEQAHEFGQERHQLLRDQMMTCLELLES